MRSLLYGPISRAMEALAALHLRYPLLYEQLTGVAKVAKLIWALVPRVAGVAAVDGVDGADADADAALTVDTVVLAAASRLPDVFGVRCACCGRPFRSAQARAAHQATTAHTPGRVAAAAAAVNAAVAAGALPVSEERAAYLAGRLPLVAARAAPALDPPRAVAAFVDDVGSATGAGRRAAPPRAMLFFHRHGSQSRGPSPRPHRSPPIGSLRRVAAVPPPPPSVRSRRRRQTRSKQKHTVPGRRHSGC